jgi:hypothetical protein
VPPLLPSLARLVYLQFCAPLFSTQGTQPILLCVFIVLIAYYSVSLLSLGGGQSVQGTMLIWPRLVCGSTVYCLAHLVPVFPSHLGVGDWPALIILKVSLFAQDGLDHDSSITSFLPSLDDWCVPPHLAVD